MTLELRDNAEHRRYEAEIDGHVAYVVYRREPGVIAFVHTEVPKALAGRGVGSALARAVLEAARAEGLKVVPKCPFIAAWMRKHPEFDDLCRDPHATAKDA